MNNIEQAIANWRRQMTAGGVKNLQQLDELESHVREDIRALVAGGTPETEAVPLALSRVGRPGPLRDEFEKIGARTCWPVKIGSVIWVTLAVMFLIAILYGKFTGTTFSKLRGIILTAHVFSITTGYFAGFVAGGFGACYVICRFFRALPAFRQNSLASGAKVFAWVAGGLSAVGTMLGMVWSHQHLGGYFQGDPKEIGGVSVTVCFLGLAAMRRATWVSERAAMLWAIGGSIVVSLAWFGAAMLMQGGHGNTPEFVPVALSVFVGIHIVLLVIGAAPVPTMSDGGERLS